MFEVDEVFFLLLLLDEGEENVVGGGTDDRGPLGLLGLLGLLALLPLLFEGVAGGLASARVSVGLLEVLLGFEAVSASTALSVNADELGTSGVSIEIIGERFVPVRTRLFAAGPKEVPEPIVLAVLDPVDEAIDLIVAEGGFGVFEHFGLWECLLFFVRGVLRLW